MTDSIKVAIAGVGSCASSLVQGVSCYKKNPEEDVGLMFPDIGGYEVSDIEFVTGFDVDKRKVGKPLKQAIYVSPNCNMKHVEDPSDVISEDAEVFRGPTLDGIAPHMRELPDEVTFVEDDNHEPLQSHEYQEYLQQYDADVLLNYMPVGAEEASAFYIENAIEAGVHVINCMPSFISTEQAKELEQKAIDHGVTLVGSDMRSAFGASRLSEVVQGSMLDSGLDVTQHIQMNMAAGTTQGMEDVRTGRTANTDFLNMADDSRLKNKHVSKENVLTGQSEVRDEATAGKTMYAGPSLTVRQRPGGEYVGSDNKVANLDMVAYGWAGARYELSCRLSVQDSPNSAGVVAAAIRFCQVASEMDIVGFLRGPSSWTQKTPPVQMKTSDAKFECEALSRRELTSMTRPQLEENDPSSEDLPYSCQEADTVYED
jgi:myo-inositol-1-phosphate synthase